MGASSGAYELNHKCARRSTYIVFCDKTRIQIFYFNSYTTIPL